MAEELNRRSRLATALIAGPAVTVGLLGIGAAPALADDDEGGTVCSDVTESALESLVETEPEAPTQDGNTVNIPAVPTSGEGHPAFAYLVEGTEHTDGAALDLESDEELTVTVTDAQPGFCLAEDASAYSWTFSGEEDDESDDEEGSDEEEVTPEPPAHFENTVVIPETEGVTYQVDGDPVEAGTEFELTEDEPSLSVTAVADEGYEFEEDAETFWSFQWDPGFEDTWPIDPPEDWEADEDRWYANVPETHLPDGYADWVLDYANNANRNAEGSQEFESDTQVHLEPSMDADTIGDLFPTDGAVWWGYLEDEDFWMIVHQYTGAAGFLPGESHLGDEPPVDDEASISLDSSEVEPGADITVTGEGFDAGEEVNFTLSGTDLGSTTADDHGNITAELTVPEDTEPGDYTVTAVGAESEAGGSASLTVIDPDDSDPVEPALSLDVDEVEVGGEVTAVGEGFEPGEDVEFSLNPELDTVPADDNGEVTAVLTIPEDADLGESTLTAYGVDSEREASAPITVVDSDDDDEGDDPVDPDLSLDTEEIVLEDFIGEADEGAGVGHLVVGLEPGAEVEAVTVGPDSVTDYVAPHTADDNGEISFRIVGFDTASDPSVYLGDYTTVVAFEDEDGDDVELEASFTVVSDDDGAAPPEDEDGDDDDAADDQEPAGDVSDEEAGDELAETGVSNTGVGLIAGLLLLIGGALAVFGYRGRFSRKA